MLNLNCNGRLFVSDRPVVMGILNATPDSFFAGSRFTAADEVGAVAGGMVEAGAGILDIGGMSSRPGAELISAAEEQDRVLPVIEAVRRVVSDTVISIDTIYAATARAAVAAGAGIVNDISAGQFDPGLLTVLPELRVPYVLMHMPAPPAEMQAYTKSYGDDLVTHIWDFLAERLIALRRSGVNDIIVDPGFGFGKSTAQNYALLRKLHVFRELGVPVLAGISRKGMVYKPLNLSPETCLSATTALHLVALQQGAAILRVHDVAEAVQAVRLFELLGAVE